MKMTLAEMLKRSEGNPRAEFYFEDGRSHLYELREEEVGLIYFVLHSPGCPNQNIVLPASDEYDVRQAFNVSRSVVVQQEFFVLADDAEKAQAIALDSNSPQATHEKERTTVVTRPSCVPVGIVPLF